MNMGKGILLITALGMSACLVADEDVEEGDPELTETYSNSSVGYGQVGDLHNGDRCEPGLNAYNVNPTWYLQTDGHGYAFSSNEQFSCWYDSGNYCRFQGPSYQPNYIRVRQAVYYQGRCIDFGCFDCR